VAAAHPLIPTPVVLLALEGTGRSAGDEREDPAASESGLRILHHGESHYGRDRRSPCGTQDPLYRSRPKLTAISRPWTTARSIAVCTMRSRSRVRARSNHPASRDVSEPRSRLRGSPRRQARGETGGSQTRTSEFRTRSTSCEPLVVIDRSPVAGLSAQCPGGRDARLVRFKSSYFASEGLPGLHHWAGGRPPLAVNLAAALAMRVHKTLLIGTPKPTAVSDFVDRRAIDRSMCDAIAADRAYDPARASLNRDTSEPVRRPWDDRPRHTRVDTGGERDAYFRLRTSHRVGEVTTLVTIPRFRFSRTASRSKEQTICCMGNPLPLRCALPRRSPC